MTYEERLKRWLSVEEWVEYEDAIKITSKYQDRLRKLDDADAIMRARELVGTCWRTTYKDTQDQTYYKVLKSKGMEIDYVELKTYHNRDGILSRISLDFEHADNPRFRENNSYECKITQSEFDERIALMMNLLQTLTVGKVVRA